MFIDTHGHYDDEKFNEDRDTLLNELHDKKGVDVIINSGADFEGCKDTIALTEKYPFVYGTIGIHPNETGDMNEDTIAFLRKNLQNEKIVGLGEIGLDYYWEEPEHKTQIKWFERQLDLAIETNMPIVVHSRDAADDTMKILSDKNCDELEGVIHCFSYSKEMALKYVDMGFYIGVGGVVTFKNGRRLKEAVDVIPMNRILLETDCPYLSPEPYRGTRNQSDYLTFVAEKIGEIKGLSMEEVMEVTKKNTLNLYKRIRSV